MSFNDECAHWGGDEGGECDEYELMLRAHVSRRKVPTGDTKDVSCGSGSRERKRCRQDERAEVQGCSRSLDPKHLTVHLGRARALPELLALHQRHGDDFDGFHISAFWSKFKALVCGEVGGLSDRLVPVCEQTVRMLPELGAREVANVAHAFAKARLVGSGPWECVWAVLPEAVLRSLSDSDPQHLSNTAWSFATAGHEAPELFDAISAEAVRRRCLLYTSPSPRDLSTSRMPSSA